MLLGLKFLRLIKEEKYASSCCSKRSGRRWRQIIDINMDEGLLDGVYAMTTF
jgi:5-methyltetrahydrofolate--homocysteine methyltransferase